MDTRAHTRCTYKLTKIFTNEGRATVNRRQPDNRLAFLRLTQYLLSCSETHPVEPIKRISLENHAT